MRIALGLLLAGLLGAATASAQEKPNFSGTWSATSDAPATAGESAPPAYGAQMTIDHHGQTLRLTRAVGTGTATIDYVLDGSATTSRLPGRLCQPDSPATWTAAWDGSAIVLVMTNGAGPSGRPIAMNVRSTLRLESPDTLRVVEVTPPVAAQAPPRTVSTLYKRTGPPPPATTPIAKARASMDQIAWLAGVWIGTAGPATFEERWTPPAAGSMLAVSRVVRNGVMGAFEFLCIVERDGGLVYSAMPNGRMPATDFTLTTIDADSALFENPAHDFPKMIRYTKRPDGSLEATVAGEGGAKPEIYRFTRQP